MKKSVGSKTFDVFNYIFLGLLALSCLIPIIHIIAVSFSDKAATSANLVTLWPVGFHTLAYQRVFSSLDFIRAFFVSVERVIVGVSVNMFIICVTAYPLSKKSSQLKGRNILIWLLVFPMLFKGGLIPTYLVVRDVGLLNSFWALIWPGAVPIFSIILMMNFYRSLPKSLPEAAMIDGAGHFNILFKIFIPLSKPGIATLALFEAVGHWNEWFMGMIYLNDQAKFPLQTYLRQMLLPSFAEGKITASDIEYIKTLSDKNFTAAQLVIAIIPILCIYPFVQKYFVKGLVIGSVKG